MTILHNEITINAPIEKVWHAWTNPEDIMAWNNASPDWHTPKAENDLRIGGKFVYTMAAKDGSFSFDYWGIYDEITTNKSMAFTLGDNRTVSITFTGKGNETAVSETFEAETENSVELQQGGWQAILNNFKNYVEKI